MKFENAYIPYGAYWSTPFCRWQGSLADQHALRFAADVAATQLAAREIDPKGLDSVILGFSVPQKNSFYGAPWVAGMLGAEGVTGPAVAQACATSAKCVAMGAQDLEGGFRESLLVVTCDRTSNGPHVFYPNPSAPGGTGDSENWVMDNFGRDPFAKGSMLQTAENVAKEAGISREEQEEVTLIRHRQYQDALADDRAFQKRYMVSPLEVKDARGRKVIATVDGDEGVFPTTAEGLAKLRPVMEDGSVTFGAQTYPADGNCGIVMATRERARAMSRDKNVEARVVTFGEARTKKGFMAMAVVPAARQALERAGLSIGDCKAIKTHNPFAVNDVYFCRELGIGFDALNNYGSSLIYGHPQGPTGARLIVELIEELVLLGGGPGLFVGCAAGDTAFAIVVDVTVAG